METRDYCTVWGKTTTNLERNARLSFKNFSKNDFEIDLENQIGIMPFRDNMPCIVDISKFKQDIVIRNKNLISIMTVCLFNYSCSKKINII